MNTQQLAEATQRGQVAPLYLLHGGDPWQTQQALDILKEVIPAQLRQINLITLQGKGMRVEDLEERLETPFLGDRRMIVVEDPPMLKASRRGEGGEGKQVGNSEDDRWQRVLAQVGGDVIVVLVLWDKADSRRRIYKWLVGAGVVVECLPLKGRAIVGYIQELLRQYRGIRFEAGIAERLAQIGGDKLGVIHQELAKLMTYADGQTTITMAQAEAVLSPSAEVAVFALTDAVVERDLPAAAALMEELIRRGEAPLLIFATLIRHVRLLLSAAVYQRRGLTPAEMATKMGLHPFVAQKINQQIRNFDMNKLQTVLQQAADKDVAIKTGRLNQGLALDLLISELAQAKKRSI